MVKKIQVIQVKLMSLSGQCAVICTGHTYQSYVQVNMQVKYAGHYRSFSDHSGNSSYYPVYIQVFPAEQVINDVKNSGYSGLNSGHYQVICRSFQVNFCSIMLFKVLSGLYSSLSGQQVMVDVKDSGHSGKNSGHYQVNMQVFTGHSIFFFHSL